jgi:hypothetical protein
MKRYLLLILFCFTIINIAHSEVAQIVVAQGLVLDNPYLHVNQNRRI